MDGFYLDRRIGAESIAMLAIAAATEIARVCV
jgi:hypothetical protein